MTALERYIRLEAVGIWRETVGSQPREVIVSFGDSTLVLTDLSDRPLGHWALAGIQPIGETDGGTIYSMTTEGDETLVIRDRDMIAAIFAVSRDCLVARPTRRRPRRRFPFGGLLLLGLLTVGAILLPGLIRDQALRMITPEQAHEFGEKMLLSLLVDGGRLCSEPVASRALRQLGASVAPGTDILVLDAAGSGGVALLPGPTLVIASAAIIEAAAPEDLAAAILLAFGTDPGLAPVERLVRSAGPVANLRYILTGNLPDRALAAAARAEFSPGTGGRPFLPAVGFSEPVLSDQNWVALRRICD